MPKPTTAIEGTIARYGQTREVAEAVAFLAGPGAAYITGSGILVDGGA